MKGGEGGSYIGTETGLLGGGSEAVRWQQTEIKFTYVTRAKQGKNILVNALLREKGYWFVNLYRLRGIIVCFYSLCARKYNWTY